jgi:hypothetical protein
MVFQSHKLAKVMRIPKNRMLLEEASEKTPIPAFLF